MESPATVAATVLAIVQDALVTCGAEPVHTAYVAAGTIAWDDCCGQLAVAPERVFRTIPPFPTEAGADEQCNGEYIAVELVVLLLRCVPTVDDAARLPDPKEVDRAYQTILHDGAIVWNALAGSELVNVDDWGDPEWERANLAQEWIGAEGGCVATETRVTVGIPFGRWCTDCPPAGG